MNQIEAICPVCKSKVIGDHYLCPGVFNAKRIIGNSETTPLPQDLLYHYTTIETLEAILKSKTLRGSHYSQLNDWKEVEIGIQKLKEGLEKLEIANSVRNEVSAVISDILQKKFNCFITSFSTQGDLLSQLRAYTDSHNGGVAIGFKGSKLHRFESNSCSLLPCSYTTQDNDINLEQIFNPSWDSHEENDSSRDIVLIQKCLPKLIQIATTIKHYGYYEEQEWRLISIENDNAKIQRVQDSCLQKQFIEYKIEPSMIDHVIISPHHDNQQVLVEKVKKLKNKGLLPNECNIVCSSIPYRDVTVHPSLGQLIFCWMKRFFRRVCKILHLQE